MFFSRSAFAFFDFVNQFKQFLRRQKSFQFKTCVDEFILILIAISIPKTTTISMPGYSAADGFAMFQVPLSCLFLVLCGMCTSIMWGCIFNMAVEGLGKYTEQASGIFMTLVVGGGIMPLIQEYIAKGAGYMNSYWLVIAMLVYMLYV